MAQTVPAPSCRSCSTNVAPVLASVQRIQIIMSHDSLSTTDSVLCGDKDSVSPPGLMARALETIQCDIFGQKPL
jgi:hypothetical protein